MGNSLFATKFLSSDLQSNIIRSYLSSEIIFLSFIPIIFAPSCRKAISYHDSSSRSPWRINCRALLLLFVLRDKYLIVNVHFFIRQEKKGNISALLSDLNLKIQNFCNSFNFHILLYFSYAFYSIYLFNLDKESFLW